MKLPYLPLTRAGRGIGPLLILCFTYAPGAAQNVIFTIDGVLFNDRVAFVSGPGDLTHDHVPDVLVSSAIHSILRLYSGRTHALVLEIADPTNPRLGASIDGAGDFDGDGTLDIVAGATHDSPGGVFWAGSARVYSGRDGHEIARWNGVLNTGRTGTWVAGLGDITGDGYSDVAVTGIYSRVWILGGPDAHLIRYHVGELTSPSVAGVGDVDGDGLPDYIAGWPQDSANGLYTGRATVYSGRDGSEIHTVYGENPHGPGGTGDHLGLAVSAAGDIDADGVPDFAVGAPGEINLTFDATRGMVRVYSGVDASILWEWHSIDHTSGPHTMIGYRMDGGGDINGDGHGDLLVASPKDLNPAPGSSTGSVLAFSGRTGELLWRTFDPEPSLLNQFVALLGDVNDDGLADFAMGNPSVDAAVDSAGRVTIYAGARGDVDRLCPASPNSTGATARLETDGPIGVGNDWLTLWATGAVPGEAAYFFYGSESPAVPFGEGTLCIGLRRFRLAPAQLVGQDGSVERMLHFDEHPMHVGPGQVAPGATWTFQLWYRDSQSPGAGFNLSDALRIRFLP